MEGLKVDFHFDHLLLDIEAACTLHLGFETVYLLERNPFFH